MATETAVEHMEGKENEELKATVQKIVSSSSTDLIPEAEEEIVDKNIHPPSPIEVEKLTVLDVLPEVSAAVTEKKDPEPDVSANDKEVTEAHTQTSTTPASVVESVEKPLDSLPTKESVPDVEIKPELIAEESEVVKEPEVLQSEIKDVAAENPEQVKSDSKELETPKTVEVEDTPPEQAEKVKEVENIAEMIVPKEITKEEPKQVEEVEVVDNISEKVMPNEITKEEPKQVKEVENISEKVMPNEITKEEPTQVEEVEVVDNISEKVMPNEITKEDPVNEEGLLVTKAEEVSESSNENKTSYSMEPISDESSDIVASQTPSASAVVSDTSDKVHEENAEKEATELDNEESAKKDSLDVPIAEEIVGKNVKSTEPETVATELVGDSTTVEVAKEPLVDQKVSTDVEMITGDKIDEIAPSVVSKEVEPKITKTEEGSDIAKKSTEGEDVSKTETSTEENKDKDANIDIALPEMTKNIEPQSAKTEVGNDSTLGVAEKSSEEEKVTQDVDVVTEEKEDVKDVTASSVQNAKDTDVDAVNAIETARELIPETIGSVLEPTAEKEAETETDGDKLVKTAEVTEENAKSDDPNLESSETTEDLSKQGVPTKKHSNGIISKVKQSIVKVKKAIIGKSPSSKTITTEVKDDIKVK